MKKTMSSVSSTAFSSTNVLKFLHLFNQMQNNRKINEKRAQPVAGFPNGLVVVEPRVLVHCLVVQKLLGHLPFES